MTQFIDVLYEARTEVFFHKKAIINVQNAGGIWLT